MATGRAPAPGWVRRFAAPAPSGPSESSNWSPGDSVIWPGVSTAVSNPGATGVFLSVNETLTCPSANLAAGGKLAVLAFSNGGAANAGVNQKLLVQGAAAALRA